MKRFFAAVVSLVAVFLFLVGTPSVAADAAGAKLRVLVTYGGHGFDEKDFWAMFDAMPGIQYTKAALPQQADLLKPGLEKTCDCVVMYDMVGGSTPEQQQALVALLNQGIGVVSLHHNLGAHSKWPEFRKIIGGQFILAPTEIDGRKFEVSKWSHDEDLSIAVADKDHPITKGIADFKIHDETYLGYYTAPGVKVLLKTDHPKNSPDLAWATQYGKSRVFYLMLGHDKQAYANPNYPKLVLQGIHWAAGK
jgi:type 1 glutamine amidotransferase